jgi:DNA-binding HxlR family transcriptional regulator
MPGPGKKRRTGCPIAFGLDTFGDRWTLLIIRDILLRDCKTYGDFLEAGEGIATNILADRLKQLEQFDIITKSRDPKNRRRYLYRLTEKGLDLTPVLLEMVRWSFKYDPDTIAGRAFVKRIERDRDGIAGELRARLAGN